MGIIAMVHLKFYNTPLNSHQRSKAGNLTQQANGILRLEVQTANQQYQRMRMNIIADKQVPDFYQCFCIPG